MKKFIIFAFIGMLLLQVSAQEPAPKKSNARKFNTGIVIYNDFWQEDDENMKPRVLNQGASPFIMYNIPVEKSALLFSIGVGVGTHNLYSDALLVLDTANIYSFAKINSYKDADGNAYTYKKSKLSLAYLDFPFQFRYETKSQIKMGLGMTFGFQLNSLTKYKGDDLSGSGNLVKVKTKYIKNLEKWRYGFTASVGYKWLELYGYYQLTTVFKEEKGPELYPVSIGISLRPIFLN